MEGRDGHLPASSQCFVFSEGFPGFPYKAINLPGRENSYVDFYLNGKADFRDLTISLYVYPSGEPEGTILNYMCETGDIIRVAVLQGLLFVSFWDEYGVSVGATALSEVFLADTWSHLLISREFETGRIKIFHNGQNIDDIDDDFPNKIRLPVKGSIRLGSAQKDHNDQKFNGRFACFQFYTCVLTDAEVATSKEYCMPEKWNIVPKINLETREVDGEVRQCVTGYVAPSEVDFQPKECDFIDMGCIASGVNWNWVLSKNQWTASSRDNAHFHLIGRDRVPVAAEGSVLGNVRTTNKMTCSRLCLRVHGCKAFSWLGQTGNTTQCLLYKNILSATQIQEGARYFSLA
ncbi:unnamed protein product [Candidula unifasciata]|uniref:Uncharacterized protein n=1 Tax=Candidula unifasciata TaxID=100452 RepID=A0A8S3Z3S2_9EUPU|nr:unnamed protein product [Candidula unifasciata]